MSLADLKRLWYCDHTHKSTGGCVCKKRPNPVPICESILNVPIPDIDQIRLKERLSRLPRARSVWDQPRHGATLGQIMAQLQAVSRMMRASPMVEVDYSSLEKRILSKEEAYRHMYGARPHMVIIDEVHMWPSRKLERRELMFHREPAEPRPTEGAPKVQKPWHKFIEPNHRKKPR